MSQIIVIESSEDDAEPQNKKGVSEKADKESVKKSEIPPIEDLFSEFYELCKGLVKDSEQGKKILKFLHEKHESASQEYKSSRPYRKILQSCISKLKKGSKDVYVHVYNVISMLDKSESKSLKRLSCNTSDAGNGVKKHRESLESGTRESQKNEHESENSGKTGMISTWKSDSYQDVAGSSSTSQVPDEGKRRKEIKRLELLLKRISTEITRLQSVELTLDDMDEENTSYIQESKLKRRFMKVYNELCKLNKSSSSTGRVIEKKIRVTSSRFSEVNRKVEKFINNPKRGRSFPDFSDIFHLVKQASIKTQLRLSDHQIKRTAQEVFQEVGEKMQIRRQQDFGFEFGCQFVDKQSEDPDPATVDSVLRQKLQRNRIEARSKMESVIERFTAKQQTINDRNPNDPALQEDNEGSDNESSEDDVQFVSTDFKSFNSSSEECSKNDQMQCSFNNKTILDESQKKKPDLKSQVLRSLDLEANFKKA